MKVISTNIGSPVTFEWNGEKEQTGIFKYPTSKGLFLRQNDVKDDTIIDRVHHGGINKACYLFSSGYYSYWKKLYPNLSWESNSMRSIGYRQVGMYLRGEIGFDELFDKILFATRQLAKRQITWLRSMQNLLVLDPFKNDISDQLNQSLKNFLKS